MVENVHALTARSGTWQETTEMVQKVKPHATRMGELLRSGRRHQSVPGDRQLHRYAVAPVVAHQAQGQAMQGRDLSTLAPLWALRARTPNRAWARRALGEGVKSCPRAGCGKLHVRFDGDEARRIAANIANCRTSCASRNWTVTTLRCGTGPLFALIELVEKIGELRRVEVSDGTSEAA